MKHFPIAFVLAAAAVAALPAAPALALEGDETGVQLSLDEALRIALENNLDLVAARKDPKIAEQEVERAASIFDSTLTASAGGGSTRSRTEIKSGSDSTTDYPKTDSSGASIGWGQLVSFGADYKLEYTMSDTDPTANLGFDETTGFLFFSDPRFSNDGLKFTFNMPFLRGFGREVNEIQVLLARTGVDISFNELRRQAELTSKEVEDAYWDLLAVRAALGVARESLKLAQDLRDLNQKKVEVGTLAPIEVTQAEAGVASREEGVIVAMTAVENAEDNLRRLLGIPHDDERWHQRVVPTASPVFEEVRISLDEAIERALENRPEMRVARQRLADSELSERVAQKERRHALDLQAIVGGAEDVQEFQTTVIDPPGLPPSSSETTDNSRDWSVQLTYTVPIGNRAAKANHAVAILNREKREIELDNAEFNVRVDVRTAVRNVDSGVKRVAAARSSTVLQRKTLDAEQKKFDNGMSTSFEVLRIQTDLSNAQLAEIRAILDYNKSLADVERAQGTLLEARGLRLEEAEGTK